MAEGRLIILSGPSCVGKSPLQKALKRLKPQLHASLQPLILYNSRAPRPGEEDGVDYYFRRRKTIEGLKKDDRYVVMDVRGDLQALDLEELDNELKQGDVFFEGNPFVGQLLLTHEQLTEIPKLSVFMSPLSYEEVVFFRDQPEVSFRELLTEMMRHKLLRRTRKQKNEISLPDLQNIEKRSMSTFRELMLASYFDYILPNHDGEDSENWDAYYYPIADARKAYMAFVTLLEEGNPTDFVEQWDENLIPQQKEQSGNI